MKKSAKKAKISEGMNVEVWEIIGDREVEPKITEGIIIDDGEDVKEFSEVIIDDGEEVKEFDVEGVQGYTDRFGNTFETYRQKQQVKEVANTEVDQWELLKTLNVKGYAEAKRIKEKEE